jgi:hypothetical protein
VIENFVMRAGVRRNAIKSVVDPKRTARSLGGHHFAYREGFAVDELHRLLNAAPPGAPPTRVGALTPTFTLDRLRINHYICKSEEELRAKHALPRPDTGGPHQRGVDDPVRFREFVDIYNQFRDELILTYLPDLREALARRERDDASSDVKAS